MRDNNTRYFVIAVLKCTHDAQLNYITDISSLFLQYELAVGRFPYRQTMNEYEQVQIVVHGPAPRIPEDMGFSESFKDYVHRWYVPYTSCDLRVA